jgi:two-component system sensor kinase FixL
LNQVWRMNSLGEMAAILSHELNQPLTAAASYLQASQVDLGRAGIMADNASRTVELAKSQVLRAGAIIRRARELLTVETQPLEPERMSSMIDDLGPIIQLLGPASDAGIQISIDNIDDRVMADRIQFQQAIVNLVRNAVEAVADRERREVRLIGRPTSAEFYEIRVEDSGPGLAPDQVERMFEPLMTTKSDGMGLGLSVTRTIVENHGGSLTVGRSEMGGAAFTFSLQRVKEEPIL